MSPERDDRQRALTLGPAPNSGVVSEQAREREGTSRHGSHALPLETRKRFPGPQMSVLGAAHRIQLRREFVQGSLQQQRLVLPWLSRPDRKVIDGSVADCGSFPLGAAARALTAESSRGPTHRSSPL
jgi:hypothetical protein